MDFPFNQVPIEAKKMSSYLLLRNNKESGPYTLDSLIQLGLKPYDLVWVEGRSAAWRYPSEVSELKAYAPTVEEQPFDRFFRKEKRVETLEQKSPEKREEAPQLPSSKEENQFTEYESRYIPQVRSSRPRSVYVTMPRGVQPAAPKLEKPAPEQMAPDKSMQPTPAPASPELETKYEQPLDEIKQLYVRTLQDRRHRQSRKMFWRKHGKNMALALGFVGAAVFLGFMVMGKSSSPEKTLAYQEPQMEMSEPALANPPAETDTVERMPSPASSTEIFETVNKPDRPVSSAKLEKPNPSIVYTDAPAKKVEPDETTKATYKGRAEKQNPVTESSTYEYEPSTQNAQTGAREKSVRDEGSLRKENADQSLTKIKQQKTDASSVPDHLQGQLSVRSNDYKRVAFGGIRDLRLTVTNSSPKMLEKVVVELQYLKPNEEPLKTELVSFRGIGPQQSYTIRVPDTNRGIKVKYDIIQVVE
jgi:hypothetical protein